MKSPLKAGPLRNPGESGESRLNNAFIDGVVPHFIVVTVLMGVAILEWYQAATNAPPAPILFSVLAAGAIALLTWKIVSYKKQAANLKLGISGEKAVGQFLERLRTDGAQVFHDIPGEGFNLDHVVIHRTGIYAVETKTWSKPDRGQATLVFNGDAILKNGVSPERDPIAQARGLANWLRDLLRESTAKTFFVRPVVTFPGWFIESTSSAKNSDVWVLNPKALPAFIGNQKTVLGDDDVALCASHLSRYIRSTNG